MSNIVEEIQSYKQLQENWDSYGAKPFSDANLSCAIDLYNILLERFNMNPIHVSPFNGGIMFEYSIATSTLEVDIIHNGTYAYLHIDDNSSYKEAHSLSLKKLLNHIESLVCRTS